MENDRRNYADEVNLVNDTESEGCPRIKRRRKGGESQEGDEKLRLNTIIITVSIILLITIIISLVIVLIQRIGDNASKYCLKPACVIAASKLLRGIDKAVDPCEDFYNYACGSYIRMAKEENTTSEIYRWKLRAKKQYHEIYSEPPKDSDELPHQNLKKLYGFCMKAERRKNGVEYMNRILKRLGGWPVLEKEWKPHFYWPNMIVKLRQQGLHHSIFLELRLFADQKNTKRNYLQIAPASDFGEVGVPKQNCTKYMTEIAVAFGADRKKAIQEMNETCEFRYKIQKIHEEYYDTYNVSENQTLITMKQLQEQIPRVNWMEFTNQILHPYKIKETDLVANRVDGFMEDFDKLLKSTTRRVQANYMIWLAVNNALNWLPQELSERINRYREKQDVKPRLNVCLSQISKDFPYVAEALYSKKYAPREAREEVTAIVQEVREEYRNVLRENTWMDEDTKRFALGKLDAMRHVVGGHEDGGERLLQQLYYAYVNVSNSENYLESIAKMRREAVNFGYSFVNKPTSFTNGLLYLKLTTSANAYYTATNIMFLPAAILQDTVYNSDYPHYLYYAVLAYLTGHEFAHAFTEIANKYGIDGEPNEWWSSRTAENYEKSTQCLVDIYENYTKDYLGYQLNGTLALEENMADMLGTRVAYKLFVDNHRKKYNAMLPGFEDFTPNQLFWIANSRFYCGPEETNKSNILKDAGHGVSSFRAVVPSAHLGYFAKDFNCALGTRMNPVEKCDVL